MINGCQYRTYINRRYRIARDRAGRGIGYAGAANGKVSHAVEDNPESDFIISANGERNRESVPCASQRQSTACISYGKR